MATVLIDDRQTALMSVLLVEDNSLDARAVASYLRTPSVTILCDHVKSLAEALRHLQVEHPDVVLLDLNLDDSSGHETFDAIRKAAPKAAILVLSGSDDEELAIRTVREGAQDYLMKGSFDGRLLLRAIRYAIERKKSEEALRQSESTVRAIFENSLDGIVIFRHDGVCVEANASAGALVGVRRDDLIGRSLCDFCDKDFAEEWQALGARDNGRGESWVNLKNGTRRLVDYCFSANILPGQHLAMLRDVTERRNLEQQLRESQKMEAVGRLAGGVAHDFNNILGIISGHAELMQLKAANATDKTRADRILSATEKAASLTRQLLAFGRKQVMAMQLLDVADVVEGVGNMVNCLLGAAVEVTIHANRGLGLVKADQSQLEQVIMNLATNAREAMPEGGALTIDVDRHVSRSETPEVPAGNYIRLTVTDTGAGMTAVTQARIFEPFFTTKKTGSGLGLSTVYGILKQSGGCVTVHSAPKCGATFRAYLPVAGEGSIAQPSAATPPGANVNGHETILLADNEDDLRNATAEYLESCGYRVLIARDGEQAIQACDAFKGRIALVISDIIMPRINGSKVVEHVARTRPDANVLMISGYAGDDMASHGLTLDPACFLQKPYTFQALGTRIRKLLEKNRK